MTSEEYRTALGRLSDEQLASFNHVFGGGNLTRARRVADYGCQGEYERPICFHLRGLGQKVMTEDEKRTRATVHASWAALISSLTAFLALSLTLLLKACAQ